MESNSTRIDAEPEVSSDPTFYISVRDTWFIVIVSVLFFALTIYTLVQMCSLRLPAYRRQKLGYRYKLVFLSLLVLSLLLRSLGNIAVYVIHTMDIEIFWLAQLLKTAPSIIFFTAYSVFIYFFGKLCTYEENSYNMSRPLLVCLNIIAYGVYAFIAVYYEQGSIPNYLRMICGYYGVLYLIFCILLIVFGSKVSLIVLTKKSMSTAALESEEFKAFKSIACRTICLTTFLIIMFFLRAVYNLLFSWGLMNSVFSLSYYWLTSESLFFLLSEFLPALFTVLLFFRSKSNAFISEYEGYKTYDWSRKRYDNDMSIVEDEFRSSEYGSFNPNLRKNLLDDKDRNKML